MNTKEILDEKEKILHTTCNEFIFPLEQKERKKINEMIEYLTISQTEELNEKYDLRPGMGLAAPQIGINKRFFVIVHQLEDKSFKNYIVFNPKIISNSEEIIFAGNGEGCLSVNREVEGIVPRFARVTINYQDEFGKHKTIRAREELSIAFQHEIDHLNGILFTDHIDKNNPYKDLDKYREI
jgi:peptide deformylase